MIKKLIFVLFTAAPLLFFSCGTTNVTGEETQAEAPAVENTEEAEEAKDAESTDNTESAADESESQDTDVASNETVETKEEDTAANDSTDSGLQGFPPLEEIEEPEITDISVEEYEKALEEELSKNQEKEKIEEPVPAEEILPPTQEADDKDTLQQDLEASEGEVPQGFESDEDVEAVEGTEETPIEPIIEIQEEPEEIIITPSRTVTLKKGETLVVTYPGTGWIYMGSTSEYNNLASRGRKLGSADTKYTLLAKEAGTQIHHFYKVDNLTGEYIDDYLEVIVQDKKGKSSTTVTAPDYAAAVPKKAETPAKSQATKNKEAEAAAAKAQAEEAAKAEETPAPAKTTTTTQNDNDVIVIDDEETAVEIVDEVEEVPEQNLEEILTQAQTALNAKNYSQAYSYLQNYIEVSGDNRDEALYLLGQLYESDSPLKNIKEAINTYQLLCDNYPVSKYWESANKRIIYLKRFYIDIH